MPASTRVDGPDLVRATAPAPSAITAETVTAPVPLPTTTSSFEVPAVSEPFARVKALTPVLRIPPEAKVSVLPPRSRVCVAVVPASLRELMAVSAVSVCAAVTLTLAVATSEPSPTRVA